MPGPRSSKPLFSAVDAAFLVAVVSMAAANPFLHARIAAEREALGPEFVEVGPLKINRGTLNENVRRIGERLGPLLRRLREQLAGGAVATAVERSLYRDACYYFLYDSYDLRLQATAEGDRAWGALYAAFKVDHAWFLDLAGIVRIRHPARHLFACLFQIWRAYNHLYTQVLGASLPVARLRAAIWESIFTCDLRAYQDGLFERLTDVATLVTGPTGTGKELVAQGIGYARYLPYDEKADSFPVLANADFHPLNLSALSPHLIEAELFGHRRGAFTGAWEARDGWLESAGEHGTLFLDEIGELDASLQVKLLRVLEKRSFERLGETDVRLLKARIVTATHRDLGAAMEKGTFRRDLYFRLCGHLITTPSLREQLDDTPDDLGNLLRTIALRVAGPSFAEALAEQTERWITEELPPDYPWPGNVRELSQCVRNMMMSRTYRPAEVRVTKPPRDDFHARLDAGALTLAEVVRWYSTVVRADAGTAVEAARRLGIDRHHLADKIDEELLAKLMKERTRQRR